MTQAATPFSGRAPSFLGDVRWTTTAGDSTGYYRLNGRAAAALDARAQAGLTSLGLAALPNAAGRSIRRRGAMGSTGGASTFSIAQANLPNITLTGNIASSGTHGHGLTAPGQVQNSGNAGPDKQQGTRAPAYPVTVDAADNLHQHTFTVALGGSGTAVAIPRQTIAAYAAICLDTTLLSTWAPILGDIKHSWSLTDHSGWYLLNGRLKTTLPAAAQAAATALGIGANLPNDNGTLKMRGAVLATGGADTATILQTHLPAFNMTAVSTTSANTHNHALTGGTVYAGTGGGDGPLNRTGGATGIKSPNEGTPSVLAGGAHPHPYSVPLGGAGTPVAITVPYLSLAAFVYLGA